jgi:hypothetical protein
VPVITVIIGLLLTALGLWGRFGTEHGHESITSLIPAFVGVPLIFLGLFALNERFLKHAMHLAAMLGCLGFLAAGGRLIVKAVRAGTLNDPAGWSTAAMTGLCGLFVVFCVNSFVAARRRRRAREASSSPAG